MWVGCVVEVAVVTLFNEFGDFIIKCNTFVITASLLCREALFLFPTPRQIRWWDQKSTILRTKHHKWQVDQEERGEVVLGENVGCYETQGTIPCSQSIGDTHKYSICGSNRLGLEFPEMFRCENKSHLQPQLVPND